MTEPREFADLGYGEDALRAVADLGYEAPTPIQERTAEPMLAGRDVVAQAPTGTGKTVAFGLPIVDRLDVSTLATQALVLVPTRELALQVAEALHVLGRQREMVVLPVYGGQPYERQLHALARGVQVVVGTPGRILDHLGRGTLRLDQLRTVVLDEADEMLNMGFVEDIDAILAEVPQRHQTVLFSATLSPRVAALAGRHLHEPVRVDITTREAVAPRVRQVYYEVPWHAKPEALARILDLEEPESAIIFVRTRRDADTVAEQLSGFGYPAQAIHGDINQAQRERVLSRFRSGQTQLLVGTDVAARGLDIPDVTHVINYDLPSDAEAYVHRIGRTGRAGQSGEAVTLVTPRERGALTIIERAVHRRLTRLQLPTAADVAARRRGTFRENLLQVLDAGELDSYLELVEDLTGTHDVTALAAAAFKMAAQAREGRRPVRSTPAATPRPQRAEAAPARRPRQPMTRTEPDVDLASAAPARDRPAPRTRRPAPLAGATAQLFLKVGTRDGVRPADLVGAITNEAGLSGNVIGAIDIYDTFCFVEVPAGVASDVEASLNRTTIRGRAPRATVARPREAMAAPARR